MKPEVSLQRTHPIFHSLPPHSFCYSLCSNHAHPSQQLKVLVPMCVCVGVFVCVCLRLEWVAALLQEAQMTQFHKILLPAHYLPTTSASQAFERTV